MKNSHRMFVQSLMSKGTMNAKDIFALLKQSCDKYNEYVVQCQEDQRKLLVDFVHHINDKLKVFGMEVRKGVDEVSGAGFYGLVNITESNITLLASHYIDNETQFFKKLVEMVVLSDSGCVGSIEAVDITETLQKKMSKLDAEDLLKRLEKQSWIGKTEDGKVYLAARAIMEMEQYIFDMFGENAVRCFLCKKLSVQGKSCEHCTTRLHLYCYNKLFADKPERKCPECRSLWSADTEEDKSVASGTDADLQTIYTRNGSSQEAPARRSQSTRKRKATS